MEPAGEGPEVAVSYSVFVSHCMVTEDAPLVSGFVAHLRNLGIEPYLAERDPQPGRPLPEKILERIRSSDLVAVFWTTRGSTSEWVNQEVGAARAQGKPVIPIVEKGVRVKGLLEGVEHVEFDREDQDAALASLEDYLSRKRDAKERAELEAQFWSDLGTAALVAAGIVVALVIAIMVLRRR